MAAPVPATVTTAGHLLLHVNPCRHSHPYPPPTHPPFPPQLLHLCVATPVPATATTVDHLLLNDLPFYEDLRGFKFASFEGSDR